MLNPLTYAECNWNSQYLKKGKLAQLTCKKSNWNSQCSKKSKLSAQERMVYTNDDYFAYKMPMNLGENWYVTEMTSRHKKYWNTTDNGSAGKLRRYWNKWSCAEDAGNINKC